MITHTADRGVYMAHRAWTFGTTTTLSTGAKYNVTLGTRNFLIQRNWKNVAPSGVCAMQ